MDYKLKKKEWELIGLMHNAQISFALEDHPSVSFTIPFLECLQTCWEALLDKEEFMPVHHRIRASLTNLNKWYHKLDSMDTYFVCLGAWSQIA